jgi:RNA polymerase sigma factor (TIGR02999 family)
MTPAPAGEVTRLLREIQGGNEAAKGELFELVLGEMRRLAGSFKKRERPDHTWRPTDLVGEVVRRLFNSNVFARAETRAYFFGAVIRAMGQALREHARKPRPPLVRTPLDQVLEFYEQQKIDVADLSEALDHLAALSPRQHQVVTLRYFGGWQMQEIAGLLGVCEATVQKDYRVALAFLRGQLGEGG